MLRDRRTGQVRVVWKLALFAGIVLAGLAFAVAFAGVASLVISRSRATTLLHAAAAVAVLAASWICVRVLDRQSVRAVGIGFDRPWVRQLLSGAGIGGAVCAITWCGLVISPGTTLRVGAGLSGEAQMLLEGAALCLFLAAYEELLCRGYAFQVLARKNFLLGVVLTGLLFMAMHVPNEGGRAPIVILNLALGHLLFLACYVRTRSLWMPIGLHAAYNYLEVCILGVPTGVGYMSGGLLETCYSPNAWTGNEFGPLGGLAATVTLLGAVAVVWKWTKPQRPEPDLLRLGSDVARERSVGDIERRGSASVERSRTDCNPGGC